MEHWAERRTSKIMLSKYAKWLGRKYHCMLTFAMHTHLYSVQGKLGTVITLTKHKIRTTNIFYVNYYSLLSQTQRRWSFFHQFFFLGEMLSSIDCFVDEPVLGTEE